jgi:signal transduction histidine kinase
MRASHRFAVVAAGIRLARFRGSTMAEAIQILLVDVDREARHRLAEHWPVCQAADAAACLDTLGRGGNFVVLLGLRLPDTDGLDLLDRLAEMHPDTPAIVVTEIDEAEAAVDALRRGAWDYVVKRAGGGHLEDLPHVIVRNLDRQRLARERSRYCTEMEALAVALRGTADGVAILDPLGRISFVNRALVVALGRPESELVGRLLEEFMCVPGDDPALGDVVAAVGERGRWSGMLRLAGSEGPCGVWEVTLTPLGPGSAPGSVPGSERRVVGIFRDVSEKYAIEQLRADFLSMITHDIKVPLTVILGYTEMLTDPEPPPDEIPPDILSRIRESGETINALVCNFLDLSRIEAGRMTLDRRPFDVREMLSQAIEHYDWTARRKEIALALEAEPLPPLVADEGQLRRVVANLLANAVKYTPNGGRVTVTAARDDRHVTIAFHDTGRGIPADEIPHLFEKYRRVREAKRTEGTGLGLFIAKTIVAAHGGDIRVESAPGLGSTFTLLLPAA